jgi:hypothetical protein
MTLQADRFAVIIFRFGFMVVLIFGKVTRIWRFIRSAAVR